MVASSGMLKSSESERNGWKRISGLRIGELGRVS